MLVLLAGVALPAPGASMPGPATARYVRGDRAAEDAACRRCHRAIAAEHDASLHARSFSDPSFQRGYAIEPQAFCRSCHAPEAAPGAAPDRFAAGAGVACVTCHVPTAGGPVVTTSRDDGPTLAPHPVLHVDDFGTRACSACHEFSFPNADARSDGGRGTGLMQKTLREHAASPA